MESLGSLVSSLVVLFAGSGLIAWAIFQVWMRLQPKHTPKRASTMRLKGPSASYRCRFMSVQKGLWMVSAPLQRDQAMSLRLGEEIIAEGVGDNGMLRFRTRIIGVDDETGALLLEAPGEVKKHERRDDRRPEKFRGFTVTCDKQQTYLADLSKSGARLEGARGFSKGDRVSIGFPWEKKTIFGWVLEAQADFVRVRFEEEVRV